MEYKTSSSTAWQEFAPLTGITSQISNHYQHGFQTSELLLSCLSSFEDHIVLGTNVGLVYLSHLPTLHTVRLKCENALDSISCISAIRSVEDLIAVGSENGCVSLFLLPRLLAPINSSAPAPRAGLSQNQKRFSVSSLHCSQITCLSWSSNGLRVVSGDVEGVIALLELDHNSGQCVGRHLHRELAPVVQLQYWKQAVAVSTTQRCLVYSLTTCTVCGVGSRGRKEGGRYGVAWRRSAGTTDSTTGGIAATDVVTKDLFNKPCVEDVKDDISATLTLTTTSDSTTSEAGACSASTSTASTSTCDTSSSSQSLLYTSRPGQRLWLADCQGTVHSTLLIKDIPAHKRIEVVQSGNSASATHFSRDTAVFRFEIVNELDTGQLVMHSSDSLIVFNPITLQVETFIYCEGFIKDISTYGQCIFILDKQCSLHCLSAKPLYIGSSFVNRNGTGITADPLISPAQLRKLGSKVYSQGSSLLDSVVKIGGAIASKVSQTAAGDVIVTGSSDLLWESHYSRNLQGASLNTVTKTGFVVGPGYQSPSPLSGSGAGNVILDKLLEGEGRNALSQDQREDAEPLVITGRVKSKPKRKTGSGSSSPTCQSSCSGKSSVLGDSPLISSVPDASSINTGRDSPTAIVPSQQDDSCYRGGCMHSDLECERRLGAILDIECLKNAGLDGDTTLTSCAEETLMSSSHFPSCDIGSGNKSLKNGVTSRDKDKIKHDDEFCRNAITANSRILDEINFSNGDVRKIDLPLNYHSGLNVSEQFFAQNNSLDSNVSLCYGPPSGSSVPSLQSIPSVQGLPQHAGATSSVEEENFSASLSLAFQPHIFTAACSTAVTMPGQREDALQQESKAWLIMTLPAVVKSFSASDDMLVLLDHQGCLYLGQLNPVNMTCAWSKTELPLPVAAVSVSASGRTLWLMDESKHAYECKRLDGTTDRSDMKQVSEHSVLCRTDNATLHVGDDARREQSCQEIYLFNTSPVASRVLELCGDDTIQFCIKDDNQVYCLQQGCPEVSLYSDRSDRCVALSYRAGLLWALDDGGRLLFRTGQAERHPGGHAWGEMMDCNGTRAHATLDDSDMVEGGRYCALTASSMADTDEVIFDIVPADTNIISNNEDNSSIRDSAPVPSSSASASNFAMCVGSSGVGWREEEEANLFFRPGISREVPQGANTEWWQIESPPEGVAESGTARRVFLASSSHYLWRAESGKDCVAVHPVATTGVWWQCMGSARWSVVSAEALYAGHGCIACLSATGGLHLLCPHTGRHEPVPLPDDSPAVCVCQRPEALWLLTAAGSVWVRAGLTQADTKGTSWHLLDLHQISDVHLCHLSLGMEVVWAVDTRGGVYMREGVLTPPPPTASTCAWLQVQDTPLSRGAVFSKVFAGPDRRLVWALDSLRRVYVRVAIFTDLPIGVTWEPVEGLRALHLSISEDGLVFALCESGAVYRRDGVWPPHNYVGTHWTRLPGTLARLSVSVDGRLWGLRQDGRLCRHVSLHSVRDVPRPRLPSGVTSEEGLTEEEENGWEVM